MAIHQHQTLRGAASRRSAARVARHVVRVNAAAATAVSKGQSVQKVDQLQFINPMWSQIKTEQQFKGVLQKLVESGKCPPQLAAGWADFYNNYKGAIVGSGVPGADEAFATSVSRTHHAHPLRGRSPTPGSSVATCSG